MDHAQQVDEFRDKLPGNIRMLVRREFKKLPTLLHEDERIEQVAQGRFQGKQGLVVATDRRVLFVDEGVVRSNLEDFPYDRITSVQSGKGAIYGSVIIYSAGNKAEIDQIAPKQMGTTLGDLVREKIQTGLSAESVPSQSESALDKLKKLGELKAAGVLTDEEFEEQKSKLIGEI